MPNPWFRLYSEFEDDPKVQMLSEAMQRRLVMLLCSRCKEVKLSEEQMAFKWRVSPEQVAETKETFLKQGFIDDDWNLINWNKRQFLSDSSTERVRKYRANHALKQDETLQKRDETKRNVVDTDTEADTEAKKKKTIARSVPPEELAGTLPLVDGTDYPVSKEQVKEWSEAFPAVDVKHELLEFKQWLKSDPKRMKTHRGIGKSIFYWLSTEQDRAGRIPFNGNGRGPVPQKVQILSRPGVSRV